MAAKKGKAPKPRTLKAMRADAPEQDRALPAFAPAVAPLSSARYLPTGYRATTLDDLRESCGQYAEAAVNEAQAFALTLWMSRDGGRIDHGIPHEVIMASLIRCDGSRRLSDGYPSVNGKYPDDMLTLTDLTPASAAEAQRVCSDMLRIWVAAGSPRLAFAVQSVRQTITAVFRQQDAINAGNEA